MHWSAWSGFIVGRWTLAGVIWTLLAILAIFAVELVVEIIMDKRRLRASERGL